ncbi:MULTISPECIES: OsmC family protein [Neobacillus]|uniref:OsmC family protein n=1 Tax=Neobacillus citreus TaxID=2833578 RepID=A0A942T3E1_9BACI|nr:OsmC family protein [Neobacillus citreus]MCH6264269.1 OsmC family protein [Neobacillus citreus]
MESFHFKVNGSWQGDRNGKGHIQTNGGLDIAVSAPADMEGPGIGSNPEELLISSSNNCYMITLGAMLGNRKIEVEKLEVVSEGVVDREDGKLKFKQIIHRPVFYISSDSGISPEKLQEIAVRAEKACFISQTLRPSINFSVEPNVVVDGK